MGDEGLAGGEDLLGCSIMSIVRPTYPRSLSAMMSNGALRMPAMAETVPLSARSFAAWSPKA